jgi:hypothetical protein
MAAFGDKIQALMDEVYAVWQKEENKGKGKWDILNGFPAAHQVAAVFGNFNYQVGNGGISQWIYNGYFHDDAEKLVEYLEIGVESDERCRSILDRVYKLDQCAQETDCDRNGSFYDEEGESGFIGGVIDGDAFDTWYYKSCDDENWWQVVGGIIDKVEARESAPVGQDEHNGEVTAAAHFPLQVYIENVHDERIGGFTVPLPTTPEDLRPFLDGAEITDRRDMKIWEVRSDIGDLGDMAGEGIGKTKSPHTLDELNYLAAKIQALRPNDFGVFTAALEAKRHCGSVAEIINLTENLDRFHIQPAQTPGMYGDFLLDTQKDDTAEIFRKLEQSENPDERAFAQYILKLEAHVDEEAYGRAAAEEENGVFTACGYLTESEGFKDVYRGPQDIPAAYRVSEPQAAETGERPVAVRNTDLAALLLSMHAAGGGYMRDAQYNVKSLADKGDDFFIRMHPDMLIVTPADLVFRRDTDEHQSWMLLNESPGLRVFVMSVTDRGDGNIMGNLSEADLWTLRDHIRENSFFFAYLDAEMKDGAARRFTLEEWDAMDFCDRDRLKSWQRHYDPADETRLATHIRVLCRTVTENSRPVTPGEFLSRLNGQYMARAANPQPDMLRVAPEAAREMSAQNAAEVFRLMPNGAEKLSPIDAIKAPAYQSCREFAVKPQDLAGIEKWARRASGEILRQAGRGARIKTQLSEH